MKFVLALAYIALTTAAPVEEQHARLHNRTLCELRQSDGHLGKLTCSNWAGNLEWTPSQILAPANEDELAEMVNLARREGKKVKVVGMGHSWSPIHHPDQGGFTITLANMNSMTLDEERGIATVQGGKLFKAMHEELGEKGLALAWMSGGIQTLTIGGAVSVGYHGSQIGVGTVSSLATRIRILKANGEYKDIYSVGPDGKMSEEMRAVRTGMGLVGIITEVELPITKQFYLKRHRWAVETMAEFQADHLPQWRDHPRFHWYWHPHTDKVWLMTWEDSTKEEMEADNKPCRTSVDQWEDAAEKEYGIDGLPLIMRWDNCTDMSYIAYTHADDMRAQPIWNKEYFVPVTKEQEALAAFVKGVRESNITMSKDFWVHERYLTADDSYLQPCYGFGQCSSFEVALVAESMTAPLPSWELWRENTAVYDAVLQSFEGRPHWAKENLVDYEYLKKSGMPLDEFAAVRKVMDPTNLFINDYLLEKLEPSAPKSCADDESVRS